MPAFVDQAQKVNRVTLNMVVNVEGKRLRPTAGKAMRANMVAAAPANDFTRLPCDTFMKCTGQPLGNFTIPAFLARQVIAKLPAENRLHRGRPKTS